MSSLEIKNFIEEPESTEYYVGPPLRWQWLFEKQKLSPAVKITYAYLVSKTNPRNGSVSIPMEKVAKALGFSYATVWAYVQKLEQQGYLRIEKKASGLSTYFPMHSWPLEAS